MNLRRHLRKLVPLLRFVRATKLVLIFMMLITGKAGFDLILAFSTGSLTNLLWVVSFNPAVKFVNGEQWVIFVYIMIFGWLFTNAMSRVSTHYVNYLDTILFNPIKARIFGEEPK